MSVGSLPSTVIPVSPSKTASGAPPDLPAITGKPQAHNYNIGTDRGSIPFNFNLAGTTVGQLLSGTGIGTQTNTADPGARTTNPTPPSAGAGRGFVNPPLVGDINSVTASESIIGIDF